MTLVAGADVAKGQWVVVVLKDGAFERALLAEHLLHLPQRIRDVELLAIDIPIGLPEGGDDWPREADLDAREFVGPRRNSVFLTPPRPVLDKPSHEPANTLHDKLTGKGLSKQTWALRERILEAEFYVSDFPDTIEIHPEVCFRAMKRSPLEFPKKTWNGQMERRALLSKKGIELPDHLKTDAGSAPVDDLLDAAAAAWTAWRVARGKARLLPESAKSCDRTRRGVIWY